MLYTIVSCPPEIYPFAPISNGVAVFILSLWIVSAPEVCPAIPSVAFIGGFTAVCIVFVTVSAEGVTAVVFTPICPFSVAVVLLVTVSSLNVVVFEFVPLSDIVKFGVTVFVPVFCVVSVPVCAVSSVYIDVSLTVVFDVDCVFGVFVDCVIDVFVVVAVLPAVTFVVVLFPIVVLC